MSGSAPSIAAALAAMFERLDPTEAVAVSLDQAQGRTLARDVVSDVELPPWDNAAMDGYACRADDVRNASSDAPIVLPVAETIRASAFASRPLRPGEAMRIMTGAPVPEGADSVVRVEDTDGGTSTVRIGSGRDAGANVRQRGEDVRRGDVVVRRGQRIGPAEVAMLAAVGAATVETHRPPRVAILASGDELVPVERADVLRAGHGIVSANSYSLAAIIRDAGAEPVDLGIVRDDIDAMVAALELARDCDLIVSSGGISVGSFDYVRDAVARAGGEVLFWRVPMRPGYNSAFGRVNDTWWLGVPGNAVSALVAGEVLLRPAVRRLCGSSSPLRARRRVAAAERMRGASGATTFLRAVIESSASGLPRARLAGAQGSAILSSSVRADALLEIPPDQKVAAGDEVDALILRDETSS